MSSWMLVRFVSAELWSELLWTYLFASQLEAVFRQNAPRLNGWAGGPSTLFQSWDGEMTPETAGPILWVGWNPLWEMMTAASPRREPKERGRGLKTGCLGLQHSGPGGLTAPGKAGSLQAGAVSQVFEMTCFHSHSPNAHLPLCAPHPPGWWICLETSGAGSLQILVEGGSEGGVWGALHRANRELTNLQGHLSISKWVTGYSLL